jgi:hypothetical protein
MAKKYYSLDQISFVEKPKIHNFKDIEGMSFGKLKVLGFAGKKGKTVYWYSECSCRRIIKVSRNSLKSGNTKSCGCLKAELLIERNKTHGESNADEYKIYVGIKTRCENKSAKGYQFYGARGISLLLSFEEFLEEVGKRPSKNSSIDRIDNNMNYQKGNIRWATKLEQANNKRDNVFVSLHGERKTISEWARTLGVKVGTIQARIGKLKWCDYHALTLAWYTQKPKNCPDCNKKESDEKIKDVDSPDTDAS